MRAPSQTSQADLRTSHPGVHAAWPFRVLFALCCAIVVFMAVHGDEHGRRPRFVWQSAIEASKATVVRLDADIEDIQLMALRDGRIQYRVAEPGARVLLEEVLGDNAPAGFGRIWASTKGVCLGTDDGVFINLTDEKIQYPTGYTAGACLVKDTTVIHTAS